MTEYRPIFILLSITILTYLSVDIFYKVIDARLAEVTPRRVIVEKAAVRNISGKSALTSYSIISKRNLFGSTDRAGKEAQIDVDELEPTKLELALLGTVAGNRGLDFAVIEETDKKKQGLFRIGDTVAGATVVKIMRRMVILRVGDGDEVLKMKEDETGKKDNGRKVGGPENTLTVKRADIDNAFKNMSKTLAGVRVRPHFSSGKPDGFMVNRIKKGSIFQDIGLKNGDIIQEVNGRPLRSADEMLGLYKELQTGSEMTVNIKRRGRQESMKYVFK